MLRGRTDVGDIYKFASRQRVSFSADARRQLCADCRYRLRRSLAHTYYIHACIWERFRSRCASAADRRERARRRASSLSNSSTHTHQFQIYFVSDAEDKLLCRFLIDDQGYQMLRPVENNKIKVYLACCYQINCYSEFISCANVPYGYCFFLVSSLNRECAKWNFRY